MRDLLRKMLRAISIWQHPIIIRMKNCMFFLCSWRALILSCMVSFGDCNLSII